MVKFPLHIGYPPFDLPTVLHLKITSMEFPSSSLSLGYDNFLNSLPSLFSHVRYLVLQFLHAVIRNQIVLWPLQHVSGPCPIFPNVKHRLFELPFFGHTIALCQFCLHYDHVQSYAGLHRRGPSLCPSTILLDLWSQQLPDLTTGLLRVDLRLHALHLCFRTPKQLDIIVMSRLS